MSSALSSADPVIKGLMDWTPAQNRVIPSWYDFKNPDHGRVFAMRAKALQHLRANPDETPALRAYYRESPADFINDWGVTFDPRLVERGLPGLIPFILFDKQREYVDWVLSHWHAGTPGLCEKSRDCGVSWLNVGLACALCLFNDGMIIGFGSRKAEYVDKLGNMKAILPKARMFMQYLPVEFRGGWVAPMHAPEMGLGFPESGSAIGGEGGDSIGRGDRASIYFVDEAAHIERAELIEAALSQTTNCRIDVSSVAGMANVFAQKRHAGKVDVLVFDHHDDPRKGPGWYAKQLEELDEITVAQEIDRDYTASSEGMLIPGKWVRACIGAREPLGISLSGAKTLALDIADEGKDNNAVIGGTGVEVDFAEEWSGKGDDLFKTAERMFQLCDDLGYGGVRPDVDGLGASMRGDARVINERRRSQQLRQLAVDAYRGSDAVHDPEGLVYPDFKDKIGARRNKDFFANRKAQSWWSVRDRCR